MKKIPMPCCGYFTYNVPANEDCGYICPVCFWENDPFIASDNEPSDSKSWNNAKRSEIQFLKNLVLVKKKCYVMSDHQEMMKKKFHSDNFQLVELKN